MEMEVLPWPPQSPDLNPIENIWAHLKKQLRKRPIQPTNHNELYAAIVEEWEAIPRKILTNMVQSMPKRIEKVIKQRGGSTNTSVLILHLASSPTTPTSTSIG